MSEVILLRSNTGTKDLIGSLGFSLDETRITGFLGYLLSYRPTTLLEGLGISDGRIESVAIEKKLETQRCDIVVETSQYVYVIEAKLHYQDPIEQLLKQEREIRARTRKKIRLIGITNNTRIPKSGVTLLSWNDIHRSLAGGESARISLLYEELKMHLENSGLANFTGLDIYAREVGDVQSLNVFLKCQAYYCHYMKSSNVEK